MKSFTLRVDEKTYNEYAAVALLDGKNVTIALRQHMEDVAAHRLPKQELEKINAQVDDVLKNIINTEAIELLAKRVAEYLGLPSSRKVVSETLEVSKFDNNVVFLERNDRFAPGKTEDIQCTSEGSEESNSVEIPKESEVSNRFLEEAKTTESAIAENNNQSDRKKSQSKKSTEIKNKTMTVGSELQRKTRNLRTFSDGEIAIAEGVSTETIRRYRVGARKPKDQTFWDKWEICDWNDKRWLKKTE